MPCPSQSCHLKIAGIPQLSDELVGRLRARKLSVIRCAPVKAAYFAHREQPFRSIVNTCFGHRERSEATLAGRRVSLSW